MGNGWTPAPFTLYARAYDKDGAERLTVFTITNSTDGTYETFTGTAYIKAGDFKDSGKMNFLLQNASNHTSYFKNLNVTISLVSGQS